MFRCHVSDESDMTDRKTCKTCKCINDEIMKLDVHSLSGRELIN